MSALEISQAIQSTRLMTAMRESMLAYPIILSSHLASIGIFGGMILLTDLRLLGVALKSVPIANVIRGTRTWKRIGFVVMVSCGIMLGGAKLATYYDNPYFQLKMTFLALTGVHAMVFHRSVYANPEKLDQAPKIPGVAKLAACVSMILWVTILSAGRWIAYYERPDPNVIIVTTPSP
jgi:hypothetical protein